MAPSLIRHHILQKAVSQRGGDASPVVVVSLCEEIKIPRGSVYSIIDNDCHVGLPQQSRWFPNNRAGSWKYPYLILSAYVIRKAHETTTSRADVEVLKSRNRPWLSDLEFSRRSLDFKDLMAIQWIRVHGHPISDIWD